MRKMGKKWILVGLLVVVVVIAGIFLTRIDPKKYYTNSFNNMKNYFITNVEAYSKDFTGDFDLKMKTTSLDSYKKLFADTEVSGNYGYSSQNKKLLLNLSSNYQNQKLLSGNVYVANEKEYFRVDDLLDNYYYQNMDKLDSLFNNANVDNNKNIINGLFDGVNNSLKDKYFDITKENKDKVVELKITGDNYKQFVTDLYSNLKGNNNFMNSLASLTGMSTSELSKAFDDDLNNVTSDDVLNIKTYLLNNKIDKISFYLKQNDGEYNIEFDKNNNNLITYNINSNKDNFKVDGNFTVSTTDTGSTLNLTINYDSVTYTLTNIIKYNQTFNAPDVSSAKNINDISESDSEELLNEVYNNINLIKFIQALYSLESDFN